MILSCIFQPLFKQCFEFIKKEGFLSIANSFSYSLIKSPEGKIAATKKLHADFVMANQALSGIVHLERESDMDCTVCMDELPESYTFCCIACFALLCPTCDAKLHGQCPMCKSNFGTSASKFIDFLVTSKRRNSLTEGEN